MPEETAITIEYEGEILTFSVVRNGVYIFYDASGRTWRLSEDQVRAFPQMQPIIENRKE